jgi:2-keto-4-pentenoate hydratase/2-oxohepta-3-ene-1,7-dioic acid hydratase in catechol pathway
MKLVRVSGAGTGIVVERESKAYVLEVSVASQVLQAKWSSPTSQVVSLFMDAGQSWRPLIESWAVARRWLEDLAEVASEDLVRGRDRLNLRPLAQVRLDPPLPDPASRIFAMGGNFPAHTAGMSANLDVPSSVLTGTPADTPPWGFYVIPGTVVGPEATVTPPESTRKLDYEGEVAVVFGAGEHPVGSDRIAVWGYTAWNDFSIRDAALGLSKTDHGPLTWSLTKNFRTGNSCGPWMVVDEHAPVDGLRMTCQVNDQLRQDGTTADMNYSFGAIAAHISEYVPVGAGDMILSGTPSGTAMEGGVDGPFLRDGDRVEVKVDGVDVLRNHVKLSA